MKIIRHYRERERYLEFYEWNTFLDLKTFKKITKDLDFHLTLKTAAAVISMNNIKIDLFELMLIPTSETQSKINNSIKKVLLYHLILGPRGDG